MPVHSKISISLLFFTCFLMLFVNKESQAGLKSFCINGTLQKDGCHCPKGMILDLKSKKLNYGICKKPPIQCAGFEEDEQGNCICPIAHEKKDGTCILNESKAQRIRKEGQEALKKLQVEP